MLSWNLLQLKLISKKRWNGLVEKNKRLHEQILEKDKQLGEMEKKMKRASTDAEEALEGERAAWALAEEVLEENSSLEKKLKKSDRDRQDLKIELEKAEIRLENHKKDMPKRAKQKVLVVGGSPERKETLKQIRKENRRLKIGWIPSEEGKNGNTKRIEAKAKSADLTLIITDYVGHEKRNAAVRGSHNGSCRFISTLSQKSLRSAINQYLQ